MTNTIQQNASTLIFSFNAGMSGTKRGVNENIFRTLLDSLNSLSDELTKLDSLVERKLMEK